MPHQCVRCGAMYEDGSNEILKGCSCGSKLFFFIKKEKIDELKNATVNLSENEKKQLEKDVLDIVGERKNVETGPDDVIVLDFESIRALKPGVFELDLVNLFNEKNPLVYKLAEGKYVIDIPETFSRHGKEGKEKK
ncbi:MAG: Zn-ribbon domain-containing protein [Candidatus Woesearchaeota archaeon]